MQSEWLF